MIAVLQQHEFWSAVIGFWLFSSAVSAMPAPKGDSNPGYAWFYTFLHGFAGNITTAFGSKIPGANSTTPPK